MAEMRSNGAHSQSLPWCNLSPHASYKNASGPGCILCRNRLGFDMTSLQTITENFYRSCPNDPVLARNSSGLVRQPPALTLDACKKIAGPSFTRYPWVDIWSRLSTWKFPLIQLAAQFPRPPLSIRIELFIVARLLGNPIGTVQDLITKFANCQGRALFWKQFIASASFTLPEDGEENDYASFKRHWKAFALIIDSCDEWGLMQGDYTRDVLKSIFANLTDLKREAGEDAEAAQKIETLHKEILECCLRTAKALAADRGTKLLPVATAMAIFVGTVIIAFIRDSLAGPFSTTILLNVEAYSIAFSATYFWIMSVVMIGAAIGSSQTEFAIPRILNRFQREIQGITGNSEFRVLYNIREEEKSANSFEREMDGGVYSWQPAKWPKLPFGTSSKLEIIKKELHSYKGDDGGVKGQTSILRRVFGYARLIVLPAPGSPIFPVLVVLLPLVTAWIISILVPPERWGCRPDGESTIFAIWFIAWALDFFPFGRHKTVMFYCHWIKDASCVLATFAVVAWTQVGVYNRCSCYNDGDYILLPGSKPVADHLHLYIESVYLVIVLISMFIQLVVVPGLIAWEYPDAWLVFIQRDDDKSLLPGLKRWQKKKSWPKTETSRPSSATVETRPTWYRRLSGLPSAMALGNMDEPWGTKFYNELEHANTANATALKEASERGIARRYGEVVD